MADRLGTYTAGAVIATVTSRLKDYTKKSITDPLWFDIINSIVDELYELSGTKDKAEYRDRAVLSSGSIYGISKESGGSANDNYVPATRLLTLRKSECHQNTVTGSELVGGLLVWFFDAGSGSNDSGVANITALNTPAGTDYVFELDRDIALDGFTAGDFKGGDQSVVLTQTGTADEVDIGALSIYKSIDDITMINDATSGECHEFSEKDFRGITNPLYQNPTYDDSIIYFRDGEYLRFYKGANIASYGVRTMYFTRMPYKVTALTDLVDIRDTNIKLLYDLAILAGLQTLKVPIPQELMKAEGRLDNMRKRRDEEIAKMVTDAPS